MRRIVSARPGIGPEKLAELDFRALVPVSLRTSSQHGTLGNQIASWAARLPIAETDPRRRLEQVRAVTADLKQSRQAMGAEVLAKVSEWTVPTLLSLAMRLASRARSFNLTVTNVPGPQIPLYHDRLADDGRISTGAAVSGSGAQHRAAQLRWKLHWGLNGDWDVANLSISYGNSCIVRRVARSVGGASGSNAQE